MWHKNVFGEPGNNETVGGLRATGAPEKELRGSIAWSIYNAYVFMYFQIMAPGG